MARVLRPDLCIIGAGSGGLSVAAGAAQLGAEVVLLEPGAMGGDCLNVGCVPSKSLLAAGHAAHAAAGVSTMGVRADGADVDFAAAHRHVQRVIAGIAPHDSQERFEGLGVTVLRTGGRFVDPRTLDADGTRIHPRRFVIATGSRPAVPPIPGLDGVPYLTNETIWDLDERPEHLVVIGGGPIGSELAQAHRRLGARVTIVEANTLLGSEDAELVAFVRRSLEADGITLHEDAKVTAVGAGPDGGIRVDVVDATGVHALDASHLLVATGRRPNVEALDLDQAGIETHARGIVVDRRLKTTNRRAFAIGDVAGGLQFTHLAGHHASVVVQNALFRLPAKASTVIPRVTYTDPEVASVGAPLIEEEGTEIVRVPFDQLDRARAEGRTDGLLKLKADRRGRVRGVAIAGPHAGELLQPWLLVMERKLTLRALTSLVVPYPTLGEINKRAASAFYAPRLFSPLARRVVRLLSRLG